MIDWWADNGPPVYLPVAGYFGLVKTTPKKATAKAETSERGDLNDLARMFAGSGGSF